MKPSDQGGIAALILRLEKADEIVGRVLDREQPQESTVTNTVK